MSPQTLCVSVKRSLNRAKVLKAGLRLVDKRGLEGLSMRRLAQSLDVGTMSLYNHVPNKDALLDGIVEQMLLEVPAAEEGKDPEERLRSIAHSLRQAAQKHPEVFRIMAVRPPSAPSLLATLDVEIRNLKQIGFSDEEAVNALRILLGYVFGYIRLETGGFFPGLGAIDDMDDGAGEQEVPSLRKVSSHLADWRPAAEFDQGLDAILSGLREGALGRANARKKKASGRKSATRR